MRSSISDAPIQMGELGVMVGGDIAPLSSIELRIHVP
jgi:hypothetical protein